MNWKTKAKIMNIAARLPYGDRLYQFGQERLGRLRASPLDRLPAQAQMVKWLRENDTQIQGATLFEVGTGHIPLVPIGFFLSGAKQIITVDLHRRIHWRLTAESLRWMVDHQAELRQLYAGLVPNELFDERFSVLSSWQDDPVRFLKEADIEYLAPMDAAHTGLPAQSIDCHFSVTVMEHIPPGVIADIFREARRILKPDGTALHFIDCSDHFQHQDSSISKIHFLRFSEKEWDQIAGNEFAYCNRLRASDYIHLFRQQGFQPVKSDIHVDAESLTLLENGFPLDSAFSQYSNDDLASSTVRTLMKCAEG